MGKRFQKFVALAAVFAMVTSLGACGKNAAENKEAAQPVQESKNIEFPLAQPETLSILTSAEATSTQNPEEKVIYQRIKKETNVNVDWTCYVKDQFVDKRNLVLAKGSNLPDIILNADMGTLDLLKYGSQGLIVPVEDLIDKYMPNLKKVLDDNPSYRKLITAPDGHIYSFPWIEQLGTGKEAIQAIGGMPFINKAWLDQLGLKMPTTTEEFVNVLTEFKNKIPNSIPMSFRINGGNEDLGFILGAFGYGDNPDHIMVDQNNKVLYSVADEGYKEGITWLHTLQEKGLIDPEAYTQDWATLVAKGKEDRYGVYFGWDNLGVPGTAASYVPMPALKGPNGEANAPRQSGTAEGGFQAGRAVITSDCKNLELAAKWIDLMYEPLQSIQNNWGTYSEDGKDNIFVLKDDGTLSHTPLDSLKVSPWEARCAQMVGGPLAVLNSYYGKYTTCPPDALERMDFVKSYVKDMKYDMVYPNVFMSQEDSETLAQCETGIKQYAEQKKAEWILNGGVEKEWDSYLQKLDQLGLKKYLEIKQKYLDAYLSK
ncbi:extracellular solute-binding protein [Anaerocolumna chitinilytica]|uniref:ABC transporter substrate-binding protein n=1 Tax=Anaerocolumna chitinilytica TaxID=1727145 RepID=A0A7I8DIE2_9FIRM|nr:extracellular solute-binding protein [Anaerocolumna chitinilytica]BCJ98223.1 ABC transporter substrate-binding protein [Anaerocolumna chitinilytica]